jgi:F0F1-type ATP synthase delta subunit
VKKLVSLALTPAGDVTDGIAAMLLERLSRSQLKEFLAALRRELKRRHVYVSVAGEPGSAVSGAVAERFPGRELDLSRDDSLGGGVRISAGDDIVDASMRGYIRQIIEELGGT